MKNIKSVREKKHPYKVYNINSASRVLLICDHASNYIPKKYKNLGLKKNDINRHIGWDIGAKSVARKISNKLNSTLITNEYSRLLIDCNRPFKAKDAFIKKSENTIIPGNLNLSKKEKQIRALKYCIPYRNMIEKIIKDKIKNKIIPIIVAIHSFTPIYKGEVRPWHLGLLYRKDKRMTSLALKILAESKLIKTGINEPYKCNLIGDFSIPYFGESNGFPCILFEIRQDLIKKIKGQIYWSNKISNILQKIIFDSTINYTAIQRKDVLVYYKRYNKI